MNTLKVEDVKLGEIHAYENNAKTHSEYQVQQIVASIQKFGFNNPILIDENNEIIAGHGRLMAAKILNLSQVPVIRIGHLTNVQIRKLRIADNRISENGGGWDADLLNIDIGELCELEDIADITITGFNDIEIDQILAEPRTKAEVKKLDTSPRQFYRYLDIAYMNPDKANQILSGKLNVNVNDLFQISKENQSTI